MQDFIVSAGACHGRRSLTNKRGPTPGPHKKKAGRRRRRRRRRYTPVLPRTTRPPHSHRCVPVSPSGSGPNGGLGPELCAVCALEHDDVRHIRQAMGTIGEWRLVPLCSLLASPSIFREVELSFTILSHINSSHYTFDPPLREPTIKRYAATFCSPEAKRSRHLEALNPHDPAEQRNFRFRGAKMPKSLEKSRAARATRHPT